MVVNLSKTLFLGVCLWVLGAIPCLAVDQIVGPFSGLNSNTAPEAIGATQSPDLLNVDVSPGGVSVQKRQGYGLDVTLNIATSPVHNLYKFFDSSGNEIRLAFSDTKINSSVNGAAWSVVITTGLTTGATWDCTDYLGFAYCVSSAFDCPIKTNGTSAGTTGVCGTNAVPTGSLVSNSGDRLLIGATSANPSRLYYSQSAVFTNFALGVQPSDSSFEDIVAPGSKLTHLAYHFGRWLWWKDQSFGFIVGTGQFDLQIITVSNTIGTLDNTDVFDGNYCYFRGSDAQIYTYNGASLSRTISTDIAPALRTANRRKANTWVQTTQSDFQAGSIIPTGRLSTTISPGDIVPSSFSVTENSSVQWNLGKANNISINSSSLTLNINNLGNVTNNDFESALSGNWTNSGVSNFSRTTSGGASGSCVSLTPQSGSAWATNNGGFSGFSVKLLDLSNAVLAATSPGVVDDATWRQATISSSGNVGKRFKVQIQGANGTALLTTSDSYILGGDITFYYAGCHTSGPSINFVNVDNVQLGSSTITSAGSFSSQIFDSNISSALYSLSNFAWIVNTSTPTFALITSSANPSNNWITTLTSSGTNTLGNRYSQYVSTIPFTSIDNALTSISAISIVARSTGTFYSAVNNAPNLTSFNTLGITDAVNGNSSISYYSRSSTNSFTILSSTPTWVSQTKNATVAASTGTFFQLRADFAITAATETSTLSDFTFNWYEGTAIDKMYGTYFNNGIWFSVSLGTSTSTSNRIFRYDLLSNLWTLYNIPANGFLTYNNNLYFGDPTAGRVFQFGNNVYSDNGTAINAYWKSKPFFGDSPFTDKDLRTASWYVESDSGTTLTVTYTLNRTTNTITKNINLSDSRRGVIQNNWNFPAGTSATVFSAGFGDNSSNAPWEVFGGLITFVPKPWIVSNP